jgi:vacuolar-type H+-ATPase subunit H
MADTIEQFVAKLQAEGVQAGRAAAEELIAKARRDADEIIRQAQARATKLHHDAEAQAQATLAKAKTELELAARDTTLRLREALARAIRAALAAGAKRPLDDAEFLRHLLSDIVLQYVRADLQGQPTFNLNVTPEMREKLAAWALQQLHHPGKLSLDDHDRMYQSSLTLNLRGTLAEAGFEYQVEGAKIEVTLTSVVDALADLVSPALRQILEQATAVDKPDNL